MPDGTRGVIHAAQAPTHTRAMAMARSNKRISNGVQTVGTRWDSLVVGVSATAKHTTPSSHLANPNNGEKFPTARRTLRLRNPVGTEIDTSHHPLIVIPAQAGIQRHGTEVAWTGTGSPPSGLSI